MNCSSGRAGSQPFCHPPAVPRCCGNGAARLTPLAAGLVVLKLSYTAYDMAPFAAGQPDAALEGRLASGGG